LGEFYTPRRDLAEGDSTQGAGRITENN